MTDTLVAAVAARPRLRGWLHLWAFAVSVAAGIVLVAVAGATRGAEAGTATAIYALTVCLLFGTSAIYHRVKWATPSRHRLLARLDHSMIFVFIAGTYTPFAVLAMPERTGTIVLAVVWTGALGGVLMKTIWSGLPRWLSAPLYLGLGWVAVFTLPDLLHQGGVAAFVLVAIGGLLYTYGAIVYAMQRPDPWPRTFGYHEVFHLCTVVAALCHMVAVWLAVY
ncbi:MAG TPA: hemolysin III family protein [Mycobacteriales bacterium]|nr:hemolysin III family protein [Mycobacteriales bacterium]